MTPAARLRALLRQPDIIVAPGAYDAITVRLAEQAGFPAIYMTGAGTAAARGFPDYGLLTMNEMVDTARLMADMSGVPVVADADTGYGNELNVTRTVREFERSGVAAIHIEDQVAPKRCGHLDGKDIVPAAEFIAKIRAAVHARCDPDFVIIARTDARAVAGLDEAVARANAEFLGIGYGLLIDIAQQDAAQVEMELRNMGYGDDVVAKGRRATDITASIARSGYRAGLDELAEFQNQYGKEPWFSRIRGGFTGVVLGTPADALRRHGMPQFDKLDIDWSLDPVQVLSNVDIAQLWAFAEQDRQAPNASTVERLARLRRQGRDIAIYLFPDSDHGMWNYAEAADGSRRHTRLAPGFYDLMADWAKGRLEQQYGKAYRK